MTTTNYAWTLPTIGADEDNWGAELNSLAQDIDTQMSRAGEQLLNSGGAAGLSALDIVLPSTNAPGTGTPWREFRLQVTEFEPVLGNVVLQAFLAYDGVPNFRTGLTDYAYTGLGTIGPSLVQLTSVAQVSTPALPLHPNTVNIAGGQNPGLDMRIRLPPSGANYTVLTWTLDFLDAANTYDCVFSGRGRCVALSTRPTHLRLKFSAGAIATGRWALFGMPGL